MQAKKLSATKAGTARSKNQTAMDARNARFNRELYSDLGINYINRIHPAKRSLVGYSFFRTIDPSLYRFRCSEDDPISICPIEAGFVPPAVAEMAGLLWVSSPEPTDTRKLIERVGGDGGRAIRLFKFAPGVFFGSVTSQ